MASTTIIHIPSDGSRIARGSAVLADNGTISTGLTNVSGLVATAQNDDVVVNFLSQTAGVATMSVFSAGTGSGSEVTVYWEAWDITKV